MPNRVVTIDLESMLGNSVALVAIAARPYNPDLLPARWRGGRYIDAIVETSVPDVGALLTNAWEYTDDVPSRSLDAGVGHTFLGWARPTAIPDPAPDGLRRTVITVDVGGEIGARLLDAETFDAAPARLVLALQAHVASPDDDASTLHARVYDALDDHPVDLANAVSRSGANRRQSSSDTPTDWNGRRGDP